MSLKPRLEYRRHARRRKAIVPDEATYIQSMRESPVVAAKELTQVANRRRFHVEKSLFSAALAAVFILAVYSAAGFGGMSLQRLSSLGRSLFIAVTSVGCAVVSLVAIGAASGIIMAEKQGKRLDVLRITPLSLKTVVMGKGAAVASRCFLVKALVLPVVASAYLLGGVSIGDVVKAEILTLSAIVLCTAMGLRVSAGATSAADRMLRPFVYLLLYMIAANVLAVLSVPLTRGTSFLALAAVSPPIAWSMLAAARLSWAGLIIGTGVNLLASAVLTMESVTMLRREIASAEISGGEIKVKSLFRSPSFAGPRLRKLAQLLSRAVDRSFRWTGALVGGQIAQTTLITVMAPVILGCCLLLVWLLIAFSGRTWMYRRDGAQVLFGVMSAVVLVAIALESCASIAREKKNHTAEILATTPAGGASMMWWKGVAIFASQAFGVVALLFFGFLLARYSRWGMESVWMRLFGVACLAVFMFSVGVGLSQGSKSPAVAVALMFLTIIIFPPLFQFVVRGAVWETFANWADYSKSRIAIVAIFASACGIMLVRNFLYGVSGFLVSVSVGLALGSFPFLVVPTRMLNDRTMPATELLMLPLIPYDARGGAGVLLPTVGLTVLLSILLLVGARINFTKLLLRGAGRGE